MALNAQVILAELDHLSIRENRFGGIAHLGHIATNQQGRLDQRPQRKVRLILDIAHTTVANLEHIGIIPTARSCQVPPLVVLIEIGGHRFPVIRDIAGGAPRVAHRRSPGRGILDAPFAHAEEDRLAGGVERVTHGRITELGRVIGVAIVDLEESE